MPDISDIQRKDLEGLGFSSHKKNQPLYLVTNLFIFLDGLLFS